MDVDIDGYRHENYILSTIYLWDEASGLEMMD
jgi:hypothetical protein